MTELSDAFRKLGIKITKEKTEVIKINNGAALKVYNKSAYARVKKIYTKKSNKYFNEYQLHSWINTSDKTNRYPNFMILLDKYDIVLNSKFFTIYFNNIVFQEGKEQEQIWKEIKK